MTFVARTVLERKGQKGKSVHEVYNKCFAQAWLYNEKYLNLLIFSHFANPLMSLAPASWRNFSPLVN